MPWSVRIVGEDGKPVLDEHGKSLGEEFVVEFGLLDNLPSPAVLLHGIDRYSNTIFNQLQMDLFLPEWDSLDGWITNEVDREAWKKVAEYARRVQSEVHTYLKFVGD